MVYITLPEIMLIFTKCYSDHLKMVFAKFGPTDKMIEDFNSLDFNLTPMCTISCTHDTVCLGFTQNHSFQVAGILGINVDEGMVFKRGSLDVLIRDTDSFMAPMIRELPSPPKLNAS